jgi:hypothetical protein
LGGSSRIQDPISRRNRGLFANGEFKTAADTFLGKTRARPDVTPLQLKTHEEIEDGMKNLRKGCCGS